MASHWVGTSGLCNSLWGAGPDFADAITELAAPDFVMFEVWAFLLPTSWDFSVSPRHFSSGDSIADVPSSQPELLR